MTLSSLLLFKPPQAEAAKKTPYYPLLTGRLQQDVYAELISVTLSPVSETSVRHHCSNASDRLFSQSSLFHWLVDVRVPLQLRAAQPDFMWDTVPIKAILVSNLDARVIESIILPRNPFRVCRIANGTFSMSAPRSKFHASNFDFWGKGLPKSAVFLAGPMVRES